MRATAQNQAPEAALRPPTAPGPIPESEPVSGGHRDLLYRCALMAADVIAAAISAIAGLAVAGGPSLKPFALAALPVVVAVSKARGLYDRDENLMRRSTLDEIPALFLVAPLWVLLFWLGERPFTRAELAPHEVIWIWLLLLGSMMTLRALARRLVRAITPRERCLVVGDVESAAQVRRKLRASTDLSATIVGRVPLEGHATTPDVVGSLGTLGLVLAEHDVERVLIAPGAGDPELILHTIRTVRSMGVRVSVLPRLFEAVGSAVEMDDLDGIPVLGLRRQRLPLSSRIIKRGMDIALSAASVVLMAPFLLLVALAIKRDSPGPVLFRQRRVGRHGQPFEILKFRTMYDGADAMKTALMRLNGGADGFFKIVEDPRVTRVGRFLRRTCIDELPQLINVLRGEMSLVGSRPLVIDEDRLVGGWQRARLDLMPGITGLWQVLGSSRVPLSEMVKMDYLYATNWSPWLDVKLIMRTVRFVIGRRGL